MRRWLTGSAVALAALLACSPMVAGQSAGSAAHPSMNKNAKKMGHSSYNPRDFSGVWNPIPKMQPKDQVVGFGRLTLLPPFTAAGKAQYETNKKFIAAGDVTDCDPYGTARNFFTPRPFEVMNSKDRVIQHFEYYSDWRQIWTDGRKKPADWDPDFMGFSTARWDGNTWVVESSGYNGLQFLTWEGLPLSTEMHQTERWQRISKDMLKIDFTFNDPKYYSKPWHITYYWEKKPWTLDARPCTLAELKAWDKLGHKADLPGLEYKGPR